MPALRPLDEFFLDAIKNVGPCTEDDLFNMAEIMGYFPWGDGGHTRRVCLEIWNAGKVRLLPDGRYGLPDGRPGLLS